MPIFRRTDKDGTFYQYGKTGARYYFDPKDDASRRKAKEKAYIQAYAIGKSQERSGQTPEKITAKG